MGRIHHAPYRRCYEQAERDTSPTAAIVDSLSVKGAEKGALIDPPGFDAGEQIKGKKLHILMDPQGLLVHAANIQERAGRALLMATVFGAHPFLLKLNADSGYAGPQIRAGLFQVTRQVQEEIVKRLNAAKGLSSWRTAESSIAP